VVGGLIAVVVVLVASSAAGFALRRRQGQFRAALASGDMLTAADLGAPLGRQATLVQFSTDFCAFCGPTRELLTTMAGERDGVAFVEIDAASRMDLAKRLRVLSTPTVLVLDARGAIASRASGQPRRADLRGAMDAVVRGGGRG
jgi:thiol-disulfide isomerase/thioredoxin